MDILTATLKVLINKPMFQYFFQFFFPNFMRSKSHLQRCASIWQKARMFTAFKVDNRTRMLALKIQLEISTQWNDLNW